MWVEQFELGFNESANCIPDLSRTESPAVFCSLLESAFAGCSLKVLKILPDFNTQHKCYSQEVLKCSNFQKRWHKRAMANITKTFWFLAADNIVPSLYIRMLFINVRAHLRSRTDGRDVENKDVFEFKNKWMPCTCSMYELIFVMGLMDVMWKMKIKINLQTNSYPVLACDEDAL